MSKVRELYLGKCLKDLDKHTTIPDVQTRSMKILLNTAQKLFKDAEKYHREGDEELAYVFFMKYFNLLDCIRRKNDYSVHKVLVRQMLGDNTMHRITMDKLELLSESLRKRYERLNGMTKKRLEAGHHSNGKTNLSDSDDEDASMKSASSKASNKQMNLNDLRSITCKELFDRTKDGNVLIMDCRSSADYETSHLMYSWAFNVPEEHIAAGMSAGKLQDKLDSNSKALWAARAIKDHVVLMDWNTMDPDAPKNIPIMILLDILQNWDPDVTYRSPIKILEGGYEYFIMMYPTLCTNPTVQAPQQNNNQINLLEEIEYPSIYDITMKSDVVIANANDLNNSIASATKARPNIDRSSKMAALRTYEEKQKPIKEIIQEEEELIEKAEENDVQLHEAKKEWNCIFELKRKNADGDELTPEQRELLYHIMQLESTAEDYKTSYNRLHDELERYKQSEREQQQTASTQELEALTETTKKMEAKLKERQILDAQIERDKKERERQLAIARENKRLMQLRQAAYDQQQEQISNEPVHHTAPMTPSDTTPFEQQTPQNAAKDDDSITNFFNGMHVKSSESLPPTPRPIPPTFDRAAKPTHITAMFSKEVQQTPTGAPQNLYLNSDRRRDFSPIPGGMGPGLTGLKNLGNTCYMNSIIQCLSNTPQLSEYCITDKYKNYINHNNPTNGLIVTELGALIKVLWTGNNKCISTRNFRYVLGQFRNMFRGTEQQDSHEFLTILMDWLHSDLQTLNVPMKAQELLTASDRAWLEFTKARESLILHLFYGQIKSTVKCVTCEKESATYECFSNLSLELPANANVCYLNQCMDMYFSGELIHGWNCPNCKTKRDAIKKLDISKLPPVLVIHLKRFYADTDTLGNSYKKKQNYLRFPLENLDMEPYIAKSKLRSLSQRTYDLYGVSNHYGTMEGGHYTAFCKNGNHNRWFKFDDPVVTPLDTSNVVSSAAYILFYTWLPPTQINNERSYR